MALLTEDFAHHADQLEGADVANAVVDPVSVLASRQYALVPQDRQVLGDVALGSAHVIDDVLDTDLAITESAEDLEPQRMGHGLEGA